MTFTKRRYALDRTAHLLKVVAVTDKTLRARPERFVTGEGGAPLTFPSADQARAYLYRTCGPARIDPRDRADRVFAVFTQGEQTTGGVTRTTWHRVGTAFERTARKAAWWAGRVRQAVVMDVPVAPGAKLILIERR